MLSSYKEQLRSAELQDRLEVNLGTEPVAAGRFNLKRLGQAMVGFFKKVASNRQ